MDVSESRTVRAFHSDPYAPTLFSPNSQKLELSAEQQRLIREVLMLGASDTRFAQKMADAIFHILKIGHTVTPFIESISPESEVAGTDVVNLSVTGTGFDETSTIYVNGNPLVTERASDTSLSGEFSLSGVVGPAQYSVLIHQGDGILSNNVPFNVTVASLKKSPEKPSTLVTTEEVNRNATAASVASKTPSTGPVPTLIDKKEEKK